MKFLDLPTAIICFGQAFRIDQLIPQSFRSRIETTTDLVANYFRTEVNTTWNIGLHAENPFYLILSGSDVGRNGITEGRFMLQQINQTLRSLQYQSLLMTSISNNNNASEDFVLSHPHPKMQQLKVVLEEESKNTLQNVLFCYHLLEKYNIQKVYLVTSDFHMFRSLLLAESIWSHRLNREIIPVVAPSDISIDPAARENEICSEDDHIKFNPTKPSIDIIFPRVFSKFGIFLRGLWKIFQRRKLLRQYYRPLDQRPSDIMKWTVMEKLDLEKKAILSIEENIKNYPSFANFTISTSAIEGSLYQLQQFNESIYDKLVYSSDFTKGLEL